MPDNNFIPEISIIMPVYNGEGYLAAAIQSVQKQTFSNWELCIINDGSTDGSTEIAAGFAQKDERIKIFSRTMNKGLIYSLNEGLREAKGALIARLDCDDEWSDPKKLEEQKKFLSYNPEVGLVGTFAQVPDSEGLVVRTIRYPVTDTEIRNEIIMHNCFIHSSILARRRIMEACGGYNAEEETVEDYGLWLRMGLKSQFSNLPHVMVTYRISRFGISQRQHLRQVRAAAAVVALFKNKYPNYIPARIKWFIQSFLTQIR